MTVENFFENLNCLFFFSIQKEFFCLLKFMIIIFIFKPRN